MERARYELMDRRVKHGIVLLGSKGDAGIRTVEFELPELSDSQLAYMKMDFPVPVKVPLKKDGDVWNWTVEAGATVRAGEFLAQLEIFCRDEMVWNSELFFVMVRESLDTNSEIEPVMLPELLAAEANLAAVNAKTEAILAAVDAEAERVEAETERENYIARLKNDVDAGKFNGRDGEKGEKGEKGDKGERGDNGAPGSDGTSITIESVIQGSGSGSTNTVIFSDGTMLNVQNGKDGKNGAPGTPGANGADGMPTMHSWDGTVLTVTSASGTSSADLKGKDGKDGMPGEDGKSAYAYAVDGGYEGTEEEFANLLANGFSESGVYELINTITLEGGESAVDITEDSAANVFALKAAFVKVETPASTDAGTGYIETYYGNQRISKHHISNIKQSSSTKVSKAEVMQRYGRWAEYTYGGAADGATANLINIVQFTNEATTMDCKYVDKVRVRVNNITFDAGTKITVWGVRI
ncbi:MAG: hypothetical protein E7335_03305 [Clostridiales bacterium]|nr:hypothetical protein [Clostridiales bacterium]